jgi:hypothetical protein
MTFRRIAQQSVMPRKHVLGLCWIELPAMSALMSVHGGKVCLRFENYTILGLPETCPCRRWDWGVSNAVMAYEYESPSWKSSFWVLKSIYTLHGLPQTCAWVWKSVCLLSGVHLACLPTPDPFHPFAKLSNPHSSSSWCCEVHIPIVLFSSIATLGTRQR